MKFDNTFDEAFMSMMSDPKYIDLSFYSFVISKMRVEMTTKVPTAGAGFYNNVYNLLVNLEFFDTLTKEERMAVLVHECQHVILQHIFRKGERDHTLFNCACDIAINQKIKNIPKTGMFPETFSFPKNLTSEHYYQLLKEEQKSQEKEKQEYQDSCEDGEGSEGDGEGDGKDSEGSEGQWKPKSGHPDLTSGDELTLDDHGKWSEMDSDDEELARNTMEKILGDAMEKAIGNTPQDIQDMLKLWKKEPKLSWKKILKKIVSSKKGANTRTIKRRDRRLPNRHDIKGKKVFYDTPEIVVGVDVSGSMSDEEIFKGLVEINAVAKMTHSNLKLVQIDTNIKGLEEFQEKQKTFVRKGQGGTDMSSMIRFLLDEKINYDVLVMISDMYIEDVGSHQDWKRAKKPTLWLNTSGTDVSWESTRGHTVYDIANA